MSQKKRKTKGRAEAAEQRYIQWKIQYLTITQRHRNRVPDCEEEMIQSKRHSLLVTLESSNRWLLFGLISNGIAVFCCI